MGGHANLDLKCANAQKLRKRRVSYEGASEVYVTRGAPAEKTRGDTKSNMRTRHQGAFSRQKLHIRPSARRIIAAFWYRRG